MHITDLSLDDMTVEELKDINYEKFQSKGQQIEQQTEHQKNTRKTT